MFVIIQIDGCDLICYDDGTIWRWYPRWNRWVHIDFKAKNYWKVRINKKDYRVHRIIAHTFLGFDLQSELEIDHIDRNIHNNTISNLRPVTHQQNMFNQDAKGYHKRTYKNGAVRWETQLKINGKQITKHFKTEPEARTHYLELKAIHHIL